MDLAQYFLTLAAFTICSWSDLCRRMVYRAVILAYLLAAAAAHLLLGTWNFFSAAVGIVPGLAFLLLAFFTDEALGYGDGLLILGCGFSLGFEFCLGVLMTAFLFAGLWALLLVCLKKGTKKSTMAFVPFLLSGTLIQGIWLLAQ